jgi:polyketide biosynthesis 3-hydroxy-3-methylglutaryl-CoA synthase-like enzyme PksG
VNFILSQTSPFAKALVIASDISRFMVVDGSEAINMEWSFAEPSSGAGAVAMLVSETPHVYQVDVGANGYYGYEVMDTCRPVPDSEAGDSDLSLSSYLDCCERAFLEYQRRVEGAHYAESFQYLSFHTPFGGMVKGAHRTMMRKMCMSLPAEIEKDFQLRVIPGMKYCQRVGNIMGATIFLSLASTLANGDFTQPKRIGMFSYGSGCCSEFYSGVVTKEGQKLIQDMQIQSALDNRYRLSMAEYEAVLRNSDQVKFGTRNLVVTPTHLHKTSHQDSQLYLSEIKDFHRHYEWA